MYLFINPSTRCFNNAIAMTLLMAPRIVPENFIYLFIFFIWRMSALYCIAGYVDLPV